MYIIVAGGLTHALGVLGGGVFNRADEMGGGPTITHGVFETGSSFHVGWQTAGRV